MHGPFIIDQFYLFLYIVAVCDILICKINSIDSVNASNKR